MKKIISLFLAVLMAATVFTGCGESEDDIESSTVPKKESVSDTKPDNNKNTSASDDTSEEKTTSAVTEKNTTSVVTKDKNKKPADTKKSELDLYEDILKRPNAHTTIIDPSSKSYNSTSYCIADINDDGKYELVFNAENKKEDFSHFGVLTIVKADGTAYKWEYENTPEFYANGIIRFERLAAHMPRGYIDVNSGDMWDACSIYGEATPTETMIYNLVTDESMENDAAKKKEAELSSGTVIKPRWTVYDRLYTKDMKIVVSEKKDIEYSWRDAYFELINTKYGDDPTMHYALLYIDDDDIPELYIQSSGTGKLHSFYNGELIPNNDFNDGGYTLDYYVEKTGKVCGRIIPIGGLHMIYQEYHNGEFKTILQSSITENEEWDATINNISVTEDEYDARINKVDKRSSATPFMLKSYEEIKLELKK